MLFIPPHPTASGRQADDLGLWGGMTPGDAQRGCGKEPLTAFLHATDRKEWYLCTDDKNHK